MRKESIMSQQGISKDVLNEVKKTTGKQLSEQSLKTIASGINQKKKRYENVQIGLTTHAHMRYCERVQHISYAELADQCNRQLHEGEYGHNKNWFIHLSGVWWSYSIESDVMNLLTCYGKTTANLPAALKWAHLHNDSIDLQTISTIGVLP
jgi:hypothetical protein